MALYQWIVANFGFFFGVVFLIYLFMIIRRLISLYDYLRYIPAADRVDLLAETDDEPISFLSGYMDRLSAVSEKPAAADAVIDAIWSELDSRVSVHFNALNSYVHTLILIGFAGTIFGSIGAFNEMFQGLAQGNPAAEVFSAAWNHGLATALYTSLGAAAIGGAVMTLMASRWFMTRARRMETLVGLKISSILAENG